MAYVLAVAVLVWPYFVFRSSVFTALGFSLAGVLVTITLFTYFSSVVNEKPFRREFLTMAGISFGVALLSFGVGLLARNLMGIEV